MANRQGLEMYSDSWWEENAMGIPALFLPAVKKIVEGYQLGNSKDPLIVAEMLQDGLREGLTRKGASFKI